MPETESQTTVTDATAHKGAEATDKKAAAEPTITKEEVEKLTKSAITEALKAHEGETRKVVDAAKGEARVVQERLNAAVQALQGGRETPSEREFLETFLRNPANMFDKAIKTAVEEALTTWTTQTSEKEEFDSALNQERRRRDDAGLRMSDQDWANVAGYYGLTDPNASAPNRLKEAIRKHDQYLESLGLGDFEARVKAAASVPSKNASTPGGSQESTFDAEGELRKEMDAELARYNRTMNIED